MGTVTSKARTMEWSSFQEDRPSSALRGGHSTFFLATCFSVMACSCSRDLGMLRLISSQAGRSQSSSPNNPPSALGDENGMVVCNCSFARLRVNDVLGSIGGIPIYTLSSHVMRTAWTGVTSDDIRNREPPNKKGYDSTILRKTRSFLLSRRTLSVIATVLANMVLFLFLVS